MNERSLNKSPARRPARGLEDALSVFDHEVGLPDPHQHALYYQLTHRPLLVFFLEKRKAHYEGLLDGP